jgi:hypothetical protein
VPDVLGYQPETACLIPVTTRVAFQGVAVPSGRPVLVFGSAQGQTAVWDPRTGQPSFVTTDDVQIIPVSSLAATCSS